MLKETTEKVKLAVDFNKKVLNLYANFQFVNHLFLEKLKTIKE
jgi:hypothetical protein